MSQQNRLLALQQAVDENNADNNEKQESIVRSIAALSVSNLHEQAIKRKELYLNWDANFLDDIQASFGQVLTVLNYTRAFADVRVRQEIEHDLASAVSDCEHILKVVPEDQKDSMLRHTAELKGHVRELEDHEHLDHTEVLSELQLHLHGIARALGLEREKIEDPGTGVGGFDADEIERVNRFREIQVHADSDEEQELVEEEDEEEDIPPAFMFPQRSAVNHREDDDVPPAFMFPAETKYPKQPQRSRSRNTDDAYLQEDSSPDRLSIMSPAFMPQDRPYASSSQKGSSTKARN